VFRRQIERAGLAFIRAPCIPAGPAAIEHRNYRGATGVMSLMSIRRLLGSICIILLTGLLYAGLHPFHVPGNQVSWVADTDALRFGEHGTILSSGSFAPPAQSERSVEIWIKPGLIEDSNTLLAFYSPNSRRYLSLKQSISDLEVRIQTSFAWRSTQTDRFYVDNAFRDGRAAFWTLTFGRSGTAVYRDGLLVRRAALTPSAEEISGRLIVANSPIYSESWSGTLKGLAVFDRNLDAATVARHYSAWTESGKPDPASSDSCVALYLFNEHTGRVVRNRARSENDLDIPAGIVVLRKSVLDPPWRAFAWRFGYWEDALINVLGFVPFGFCVCAFLRERNSRSPLFLASISGAVVSLFIELAQIQLPTRDSSLSDLIDNSLGSVLGAWACRGAAARVFDEFVRWTDNRLRGSRTIAEVSTANSRHSVL
jgi:hypothetical protein